MPSEAARLTAAATPITFADGSTYLWSPLTDRDIAELDEWVQSRAIALARLSLSPDTPQAERDETIRIAIQTSVSMSAFAGRGARMMSNVDGTSRIVWQSLRRNHPALTHEEIRARLFDLSNPSLRDNMDAAWQKFREANGVSGVADANPPKQPEPNRRQRRTKASRKK